MSEEENELEGVPKAGDVIAGKYRVDRVLGIGGMGCVLAATHLSLDQTVAIKFLLAKAARNPKNLERFKREARAAAKIKCDHVAKVIDVSADDNGAPFMVMEFLDGEDMSERIERAPMEIPEVVDCVLQASVALAEAHTAGIVHRDLKPANLFLSKQADDSVRVKVLDFGISKIIAGGQAALTKTSALMGSPLYMAPEQMMSAKAADERADLWALGCILFEGITRQPPFIGETLPEICSKILTAPPTPLRSLLPSARPELQAVIEKALSKKPEDRFQNLGELAAAIAPWSTQVGMRAAQAVRRVLNQAPLPGMGAGPAGTYPEGPGSRQPLGAPSYQYPSYNSQPGAAGGYAASVGQASQTGPPYTAPSHSPSQAQSHAQSYPEHSQPEQPNVLVRSGAISGSSSQDGLAATALPDGVAPATTGAGASTTGGSGGGVAAGSPQAMQPSPAMMQGASTAAPLASTMSERSPRKTLPLVLGALGLAAVVGVAAFLIVGSSTQAESDSANAALGDTASVASVPEPPPPEPAQPEPPEPETSATVKAEPATPKPPPAAGRPPFRPPPQAAPPPPPEPPPPPPPPEPDPQPKGPKINKGDDLFNSKG